MYLLNLLLTVFYLSIFTQTTLQYPDVFFYDSFRNLNKWKTFQFSKDKKPTKFEILTDNKNSYLQIRCDSSASGLICKTKLNPNHYSLLKWKWKVENIIPNTDGKIKDGDDYAIRLYVMFEQDSTQISFWSKLEKQAVKLITGYEPPYKSLCYVWANSGSDSLNYFSPYTDDVMIIPKQFGKENCNQWITEQINIVEDFEKYFKQEIPTIACLAILGDTDNTESQTISYIDDIEIK